MTEDKKPICCVGHDCAECKAMRTEVERLKAELAALRQAYALMHGGSKYD